MPTRTTTPRDDINGRINRQWEKILKGPPTIEWLELERVIKDILRLEDHTPSRRLRLIDEAQAAFTGRGYANPAWAPATTEEI